MTSELFIQLVRGVLALLGTGAAALLLTFGIVWEVRRKAYYSPAFTCQLLGGVGFIAGLLAAGAVWLTDDGLLVSLFRLWGG